MNDLVNGLFEFFGGCLLWLSIRRVMRDKKVAGVSALPVMFFAGWGAWNLYYYPSLGQTFSFLGGLNIVIANIVWIVLLIRYGARV